MDSGVYHFSGSQNVTSIPIICFPHQVSAPEIKPEDEIMNKVVHKIDKELLEVARRETMSVLRDRAYTGLSSFTFEEILAEMKRLCPTVFKILSSMIPFDLDLDKTTVPLVLIHGIVMFKRSHEMSRLQRLNTVLLSDGNASKEVYYIDIKIINLLPEAQ